jgi:hypothetical protein
LTDNFRRFCLCKIINIINNYKTKKLIVYTYNIKSNMPFRPNKYKCHLCNYSSNIHQRFIKHTQTKKHINRLQIYNEKVKHETIENNNNNNNNKEINDKPQIKKNINNAELEKIKKIIYNVNEIQKNKYLDTTLSIKQLYSSNDLKKDCNGMYKCICLKNFKFKNNLSRHKQNCYYCKLLLSLKNEVREFIELQEIPLNTLAESYIYNKYGVKDIKDLLEPQQKEPERQQQHELQLQVERKNVKNTESISELLDLCKIILEKQNSLSDTLIKAMNEPKIVNINNNIQNIKNSNINNIKNNNINIVQYLNNECKEAPNLTDFINQISVSYDDLLKVKDNGYIYGIENSLLNQLKLTEKTKRPIHCTDKKRKKFYVKEKDIWHKDEEHKHIDKAIKHVCTKQINTLQDFKKHNTDWLDNDTIREDVGDITAQICKIYTESGEKLKSKILGKLSEITTMKE